jgi:hypothetical protein
MSSCTVFTWNKFKTDDFFTEATSFDRKRREILVLFALLADDKLGMNCE